MLAMTKALKRMTTEVLKLNPNISQESSLILQTTEDPLIIANALCPYISLSLEEQLEHLANFDASSRIKNIIKLLSREIKLLELSSKIQNDVQNDMRDSLKKNFLHEQMAAIKKELGDGEGEADELDELYKSVEKLDMPKEVKEVAHKEIERMEMMSPGSPEYMISWTYANWLKDMPWVPIKKKKKPKITNLVKAKNIFDTQHSGLEDIKNRILEYIAVQQYKGVLSGQIILLVGPPGVGKTSLAKSVASVLERPLAKVALGGVRDEAEIRGHRRTYVGSMPGKIAQAVKESGSHEAVILLDEVDKVSGINSSKDVSSALLEVLDSEQNHSFVDHYLGVPYDLSKIFFIATANSRYDISPPLLDRMEVIELSGYTETEKLAIAKDHIIPQIREEYNLNKSNFSPNRELTKLVINHYTREAGVRTLKREFQKIARKTVKSLVVKKQVKSKASQDSLGKLTTKNLTKFLGLPKYIDEPRDLVLTPGVCVGLAYTSFGGDILYVEAQKVRASKDLGRLILTGSLGKVMQESAQTCLSYLSVNAEALGLDKQDIDKNDIHLHFPDGATPKDGPSAGVAILCAVVGLLTQKELPNDLAMTGEITLRGKVLPIGGVKEKLIAAHRYGKKHVIIPHRNCLDLNDLPREVLKDLKIYPVKTMEEVLRVTKLLKAKSRKSVKTLSYKKLQEQTANINWHSTDSII
jgi:ATP-dependent Lon protease